MEDEFLGDNASKEQFELLVKQWQDEVAGMTKEGLKRFALEIYRLGFEAGWDNLSASCRRY